MRDPADILDRVDDVFAQPLLDLQRDRRLACESGVGRSVLEGAPHRRDVGDGDDGVILDLHG